jgi:hypothetical protein
LPWAFWVTLIGLLADRFERRFPHFLRWRGRYRLLCLDGTCLDVPNWPDLAHHFGTAGKGKGQRQAQARLVLLQLTQTRLPWRFDVTPLADSETAIAARLLTELREDDLVLMDRGFWSYKLFWQIQGRQAFFVIRLRQQVKPQTVRRLGPGDRLVRWQPAPRARRGTDLPAAIPLRVVDYQVPGFRPSALVTNLRDAQAVPAESLVRVAGGDREIRRLEVGVYHQRWEIETTFYELKVTQGLEGGIRSRTAASVRYEIAGHLLLYQALRWLMAEAAEPAGVEDPRELSYQEAWEECQDMRPALVGASVRRVRQVLRPRLLERLGSHRVPYRPGRHYRRPHDTKAKAKGHGRYQPASKVATWPDSPTGSPTTKPTGPPRVA